MWLILRILLTQDNSPALVWGRARPPPLGSEEVNHMLTKCKRYSYDNIYYHTSQSHYRSYLWHRIQLSVSHGVDNLTMTFMVIRSLVVL